MKQLLAIFLTIAPAFAQSWPTSVLNPLVAKDNIATTLSSAMLVGDNVAIVTSGTGWQANMIAYICDANPSQSTPKCTSSFEAMLVTAVNGNVLTVTRAYGGTSAVAHAKGRVVANAPVAQYYNSTIGEVVALEQRQGLGAVTMRRNAANTWTVYKPDGTTVDTTGTTSQGLQEAINYAQQYGFPLVVMGGGITSYTSGHPSNGNPVSTITTTSTIAFPTGWNQSYDFYNINLNCFVGNNDCITYDSTDLTKVDWHDSQLIYPGTAAVHHFNPQHNNGESFAGFTESRFMLGHVVLCKSTSDLTPDDSKGTGVRITVPNLAAGYTYGNGKNVNNYYQVTEINGGLYGFQLDNPATGSGGFGMNFIDAYSIHGQSVVSLRIGTSALTNTSLDTSWGNRWRVGVAPENTAIGISTYGGADTNSTSQWQGDVFEAIVAAGATGVVFQSSATNNIVDAAIVSAATPYTNSATAQTNIIRGARGVTAGSITPTGSPFVYQNADMVPESVIVSGGTVSAVETTASATCAGGWFTMGATAGTFPMRVGQCMRVTYTVAPAMNKVF